VSTSTNYNLRDTLGEFGSGTGTSANYQLAAGYRVGEQPDTLNLVIRSQEPSTVSAYSAFNTAGNSVTVSTVNVVAGDYIAVVENVGFGELVAVGKVASILGNVISVDRFDGATSTMSAVPAGGNDFVYRVNGSAAAYGTLSVGAQNVSVTLSSVNTSIPTGYSVYLQANQRLQNGSAQAIADVSDGQVSPDAEEYGASTTGTTALLTAADFAIPTSTTAIQSRAARSVAPADRIAMVYKLSVTSSTNVGSYTQAVYYTLTANY